MKIEVCPWVSWRSYKVGTVESRTIISDEQKGCYYLFEKESSDIWNYIACGTNLTSLQETATEIGCRHDLDDFLINLQKNDLILGDTKAYSELNDGCRNSIIGDGNGTNNSNLLSDITEWAFDNGFLWSVHWEMTYRCNQKCIHCINPVSHNERNSKDYQRKSSELTTIEAIKLLDDLAELGVFELTLSGGEATLRPDFIEILRHARKKGFCVAILTNGRTISDSLATEIAALWPNLVAVSVYSAINNKHDNMTSISGSYENAIKTLQLFAQKGIQIKVSSLQTRDTIDGFLFVKDLGRKLGALTEFDVSVFPKLNGDATPQNYEIDSHDVLVLMAATPGSPIEVKGTSDELKSGLARFDNSENPICRAGWLSISLNPSGEVTPCLLFPKYVGSVRTNTINEIWKQNVLCGDWAFPENKSNTSKKNAKIGDLVECGKYSYCPYCPMCPGKAYLETGNSLLPSQSNCKIAKARQEAAKLIMKGLTRNEIAELKGLPINFGRL